MYILGCIVEFPRPMSLSVNELDRNYVISASAMLWCKSVLVRSIEW